MTPLEAVKCLKEQFEICGIKSNPYLKIIETALKDRVCLQKQVNNLTYVNNQKDKVIIAFDIIKERNVDVSLIKNTKNYDEYCSEFAMKVLLLQDEKFFVKNKGITEEEYELLKEELL